MTEHAAFAELPVPWHVAFQEHSRAGCEQVHAVFWSSHLPGPLHINARQGAVYWCRQHGTRGARTSTSYVPAEVLPVPEGYVPSTK